MNWFPVHALFSLKTDVIYQVMLQMVNMCKGNHRAKSESSSLIVDVVAFLKVGNTDM